MRFVQLNRLSLTLVSTLLLAGCLDLNSSDEATDDRSVGQLNYHGISGLTYQTQSQSGEVTEDGEFRYYPGETLTFWVGDLLIADGVPAQEFVTLLEFIPEIRERLANPAPGDLGLSTHTITEQELLDDSTQMNLTRFLLALNWTSLVDEGEGIDIRERVIEQLNAALPGLEDEIDFTVSEDEFTLDEEGDGTEENPPVRSPANQLLFEICFYPEDDDLCEEPPTLAEIQAAEERPNDPEKVEDGVTYRDELEKRRDRILASKRRLSDVTRDEAKNFMTDQLHAITTEIGNRYYLQNYVASYASTDTDIKTVEIHQINGSASIADMDAVSTRPQDVVMHATSWQEAEMEYFVAGEPEGESELIISFRPEDTYRWIKKQLRVIIE